MFKDTESGLGLTKQPEELLIRLKSGLLGKAYGTGAVGLRMHRRRLERSGQIL